MKDRITEFDKYLKHQSDTVVTSLVVGWVSVAPESLGRSQMPNDPVMSFSLSRFFSYFGAVRNRRDYGRPINTLDSYREPADGVGKLGD